MAYQTVPRKLPEEAIDPTVAGGPVYEAAKRTFDVLVSVIALIMTAPIWIVVSLLLWTSPGPIIFRQTRCGKDGRPFTCYKFRTMVEDAHERRAEFLHLNQASGPVFKAWDDPRVTSIGRWLRRTSIDELPQLINVLRGEMSIVGPRPPLPEEVDEYSQWQLQRLAVKPGLTCLWQISGRSLIGFEEWVALDLAYISRRSFWYDVTIVLRTVPAVLSGVGAV
ncbi:MAG: sugar transferase [Dehalococcoidia bacterium]